MAVLTNVTFVVDPLGLNVAENVLHLAIGVVLAAVGFGLTN